MNIPSNLPAGDSKSWDDDSVVDEDGNSYTSTTHELKYFLRGPKSLTLTGTANGTGWTTSISKDASGALTPGIYYWSAAVISDDDKFTVASGQIEITPNMENVAEGFDGRSQKEKDVAALESAVRVKMSNGLVSEYSFQGRSLRTFPLSDLIIWRDRLKAEIAQEKQAEKLKNGLGNPNALYVRLK